MNHFKRLGFGLGLIVAGLFYYSLSRNQGIEMARQELQIENSNSQKYPLQEDNRTYNNQRPTHLSRGSAEKKKDLKEILSYVGKRVASTTTPLPLEYVAETEFFPVDESYNRYEMTTLFREDCAGNCIYVRGEGGVTKIQLKEGEAMTLYDPAFPELCFKLIGRNVWVDVDENGEINAWGRGIDDGQSILEEAFQQREECR
ncbi:hypothetical protein HYX13_01120 [Candidatus Woesearchaeota archaeon]|nr:hypothetical protein [Candidatus Woesearchaeota archaeon]